MIWFGGIYSGEITITVPEYLFFEFYLLNIFYGIGSLIIPISIVEDFFSRKKDTHFLNQEIYGCLVFSPVFSPHLQRKTVAYSRVSSHDQKKDLERQQEILSLYCASKGWQYETIGDLGSGMNYRKKGLLQLLALSILPGRTLGHHP